jgi:glucokinase
MQLHTSIMKSLQRSPLSLADLQTATQVSLPTLRKAVQELTDSRWIRVIGHAEANGGRPAMLFGLDDAHYALVGVHIQLPGMHMIVSDLTGRVLDQVELFEQVLPTPDEALQAVIDYAAEAQRRLQDRQMIGVGIAAPGFTDPDSGDILAIGRVPGWQNFPICQRLRAELGISVEIANDVDCMAFTEFQHSKNASASNLTYIGFDEGLKVSMFLNGELYRGSFGNAGLVVDRFLKIDGGPVSPAEQARLLTISGLNQMFEEKVAQLPSADQQLYTAMLTANYRQRLGLMFAGAERGLPICEHIVSMMQAVLAAAVANSIYMIQPDVVVLGGLLSTMPTPLFTELSTAIRAHLPALFANRILIKQAQHFSSSGAARGANYHLMESLFLPGSFNLLGTR